jgi:hypothetical protein
MTYYLMPMKSTETGLRSRSSTNNELHNHCIICRACGLSPRLFVPAPPDGPRHSLAFSSLRPGATCPRGTGGEATRHACSALRGEWWASPRDTENLPLSRATCVRAPASAAGGPTRPYREPVTHPTAYSIYTYRTWD